MKTEVGGPLLTLWLQSNAVSEMSLVQQKWVSLKQTEVPQHIHTTLCISGFQENYC
jgi:hypothetical protein